MWSPNLRGSLSSSTLKLRSDKGRCVSTVMSVQQLERRGLPGAPHAHAHTHTHAYRHRCTYPFTVNVYVTATAALVPGCLASSLAPATAVDRRTLLRLAVEPMLTVRHVHADPFRQPKTTLPSHQLPFDPLAHPAGFNRVRCPSHARLELGKEIMGYRTCRTCVVSIWSAQYGNADCELRRA
ncbi:hypothetical protein BJV74DRAFT_276930 [Russula compacta]|nr:hypothetical protein BJV74DRAFT_276930 [Russula compacta]